MEKLRKDEVLKKRIEKKIAETKKLILQTDDDELRKKLDIYEVIREIIYGTPNSR